MSSNEQEIRKLTMASKALRRASDEVKGDVDKVIKTNAGRAKNAMILDAQRNLRSRKSRLKHFKHALSYDRTGDLSYEVGPDKKRSRKQGKLGNIVYFGTSKTKAILDISYPLKVVAPLYEKDMDDLLGKVVKKIE